MSKYTPTQWANGSSPAINADNLNKIENGISTNRDDIDKVLGSMKFMGITSVLPTGDISVGDVYEAYESNLIYDNKIGDLLVYTGNPDWHVIPSGDETSGTVTRVTAGDGISISGGAITDSGTISVDPTSYLATTERSGFLHKDDKEKLNRLRNVALTGDWNDLDVKPNIPPVVQNIGTDPTIETEKRVVSEKGIIVALSDKAESVHEHSIDDVQGLRDELDNEVAKSDHDHGYIHNNGKLYNDVGAPLSNYYLRTNGDGKIYGVDKISSRVIDGYDFTDVNIHDSAEKITKIEETLTPGQEAGSWKPVATADHTHEVLSRNEASFVPKLPADSVNRSYSLHSDGWVPLPEDFVNYIYPVGSYYETYLPPYPGTDGQGGTTIVRREDLTEQQISTLGLKWFNPNYAWGGLWKLETAGFVHVSAGTTAVNTNTQLTQVAALSYPVDAASKPNQNSSDLQGLAAGDGGERGVALLPNNCALPSHSHGFNATFQIRQGIGESTGSRYQNAFSGTNTVYDTGATSSSALRLQSVDKIQSGATANVTKKTDSDKKRDKIIINGGVQYSQPVAGVVAHNNMQPYYNVYRWVRVAQDGDQSIPLSDD